MFRKAGIVKLVFHVLHDVEIQQKLGQQFL